MTLHLEPRYKIKEKLGIQEKGPVHRFLTATCAKHNDKYVPFREGKLAETVIFNGEPTGNVEADRYTYTQVYASYVYYGQRKDGSRKIVNWTKDKHALAGPYWDKRMWTAEKDIIIKEVQDYVGGKKWKNIE